MDKFTNIIGATILALIVIWFFAWIPVVFFFAWLLELSFGLELQISRMLLAFILNIAGFVYALFKRPKYFIKIYKDLTPKQNG
jgi:hypothetical protein